MAEELKPHEGAAKLEPAGADDTYIEVEAEEREQAGYKIYVAVCPRCHQQLALNALGRAHHRCGARLKYVKK